MSVNKYNPTTGELEKIAGLVDDTNLKSRLATAEGHIDDIEDNGVLKIQRNSVVDDCNDAIPPKNGMAIWWGTTTTTANIPNSGYGSIIALRTGTTVKQYWFRNGTTMEYARSIECDNNGNYASTNSDWEKIMSQSDITPITDVIPSTASASNQLITRTTANDYLTNLGWGAFSGNTIGESVVAGVNSLLTTIDVTRSYMLRGTYPAVGYWQAFISPPRTPSGHMWQAFVQYERVGKDSHTSRGLYVVEFSYDSSADAGSKFTLVNESSVVKSSDLTSTVTSGSTAPITSGGVYSALKKHRICVPLKSNDDTELATSSAAGTGSVALTWDTWLKSNISFGTAIRYRFILTGTCNSGTATIKFGAANQDLATLSLTANSNAIGFNRPYATSWISNEIGANIYMYKSAGSGKVTWSELSVEIEYTEA